MNQIPPLDDKGSVLLVTVIILLLLTLIGVSGINTASNDLQITRNYRVYKENLMLADAAVNQASIIVHNSIPSDAPTGFLRDRLDDDELDGFYDIQDLIDEDKDKYLKDPDEYDEDILPVLGEINVNAVISDFGKKTVTTPVSLSSSQSETQYVVYVSTVGDEDDDPNYKGDAVIIARSRKNGGNVIIEAGIDRD
ncbi:MAG: hypothetical protein K9K81_01900 [Desulfobacteraceae bacterium]|nr:hypothetical protein [Desulfobacteraceae bacterium]